MSDTPASDSEDEAEAVADDVEKSEEDEERVSLQEMDPEEMSVEDLEEQEWTLGGDSSDRIKFGGMVFEVTSPDDEVILNLIASAALAGEDADGLEESGSDRMYQFVDAAIVKPEMSPERWRNLRTGERIGLTMRIAEREGIHHLMDFPAGGENPLQDA